MLRSSDPAWSEWVGSTVALPDGSTGIVRMARRECAGDTLWVVDTSGTMHMISRRRMGRQPCAHIQIPDRAPKDEN